MIRAAALLLALVAAFPAAEPLTVTLRPTASVAGPRALLGDVADITGDPAAVALAARRAVADLPDLTPISIDARLVRAALGAIDGPSAVVAGTCVLHRTTRTISSAALAAAATATAATAGGSVETSVVRPAADIDIPAGGTEPTVSAEPLDRRQLGETAYRVRILAGDRELGRALVVLDVRRWREALVADRALPRGTLLSATDLRRARLAITRQASDPIDDPAAAIGLRLRRDLDPGTPIIAADLAPVAAVSGGSQVELVWSNERISLTGAGTAMATGKVGDRIAVRRSGDGRTIHGDIIAPGRVRITTID